MEEEIKRCLEVLRRGGTILYPTDTIWGIGCDATSERAVDKIYGIKKRLETKSLIILLDDEEKIARYVTSVPEIARDLINGVDKPTTVIYPGARNLPKNLVASDGTVAIRIVRNDFCKALIQAFGKPIVSSSANISGEPAPSLFKNISETIKQSVDYSVSLYQNLIQEMRPSRIIKISENGEFEVIRP
jgi:L-threonylcarbamoyladenylate synthase